MHAARATLPLARVFVALPRLAAAAKARGAACSRPKRSAGAGSRAKKGLACLLAPAAPQPGCPPSCPVAPNLKAAVRIRRAVTLPGIGRELGRVAPSLLKGRQGTAVPRRSLPQNFSVYFAGRLTPNALTSYDSSLERINTSRFHAITDTALRYSPLCQTRHSKLQCTCGL